MMPLVARVSWRLERGVIAEDIAEDLRAALAQFEEIAGDLAAVP